ncbi:TIGR03086 family metal-binding protein [Nocardioides sp.]|uniref:TIGR03086 family metal-binding protein n=1 Tax=Nocardioides sp. TaxID=35761 RepID=UPI00271968C3|nr:TIGR03086 family metal-binding protein [Nocardioides sp.]MDO9457941.1 TIGR03086 family metal-binding protein [Nocardioides sp.]
MANPDAGVELLERALAYTRGTLLHVRPAHLHRPTPCAGWDLDRLLDHMDDALDAFTEGAVGVITLDPTPRALDVRVATLQLKACGLLGAWSAPGTPGTVVVGGLPVPTPYVVRLAAVEITTHGWDVAQATGRATPVPDGLARALHRSAEVLVDDSDRGDRFAAPLTPHAGAGPGERLMAFLGRADRTRAASDALRTRPA